MKITNRVKEKIERALSEFAINEWVDFMFDDEETGERFFVELKNSTGVWQEAFNIAEENFEKPKLVGIYSSEDAEILGYDTY